jgi:undecaprenyl-diphosphatase
MFLELLKTTLYGIIEGITEWLPISSTGHLIIADRFLNLGTTNEFKEVFDVVIQFGAILAVVILFWSKLWPFSKGRGLEIITKKADTWMLWFKVIVACIPAIICGMFLDDFFTEHFYNVPSVAIMLIVYGLLFIIIEKIFQGKDGKLNAFEQLNWRTALLIGLIMCLSLMPGTSRSGVTILGALILGCSREIAAEFSFFLGIPIMAGASLLKVYKYIDAGHTFASNELIILAVGTFVSFIVSIIVIKFFIDYIKNNDFSIFGWYRIVLGAILLIYFFVVQMV